jgi:hypothetical protein
MLIRGLVHADSPDEALETAKLEVFTPLVDRGPFDYYVTFDADGRGVAGSDRWGNYPIVARADGADGEKLVEEGWQATVNEYEYSFDRVEEFLSSHDRSELWEDGDVHREYHYAFHTVGEFEGAHTYLYDEAGQGIRDRGHLQLIENAYEDLAGPNTQNQYRDKDLYVVPADVHY